MTSPTKNIINEPRITPTKTVTPIKVPAPLAPPAFTNPEMKLAPPAKTIDKIAQITDLLKTYLLETKTAQL